jgi:protein subunit release factor B
VNGLNEGFVLDFFFSEKRDTEREREREREREIQWCKDFVSCLYSEEKTRPDQTRPEKRSVVKNTNGKIN